MKKLFFIISVTSVLLFAKPCMTDIYTGNGINTTDKEAWKNMKALRKFMLNKARPVSKLDKSKYNIDYSFNYIHNPDHGFNNDMMETYYQLKESGQISDGFFHTMFSFFAGNIPENALHKKYMDIVDIYEADVNSIYWKYYTVSFSQKHNVLLVAHSQGNLIGNKVYTLLDETEKKKFRMISVATPASYVKIKGQKRPYVTAHADLVINNPLIPNHLPTNVAGTGHNFIHTYLNAYSDARHLIASYVKSAYDNLIQTTSCRVYEAVYMKIYDVDTLEVYAFTTNTFPRYHDLLDTIALETYDATRGSNNELTCGSPTYRLSPNTAFSSCTYETGTSCNWSPGDLYIEILEQRKGTTHHVLHNGKCTTLSLSGELYDLVENALE